MAIADALGFISIGSFIFKCIGFNNRQIINKFPKFV